jgi:hypothetical protein
MFDDLSIKPTPAPNTPTPGGAPASQFQGGNAQEPARPAGIEDIFDNTEKAEKPAILKPIQPEQRQAMAEEQMIRQYENAVGAGGSSGLAQKLFTSIALIAVLALLGVGGWWGYRYFQERQPETATEQPAAMEEENTQIPAAELPPVDNTARETATPEETVTAPAAPDTITPVDTDQDGLSDEEERLLGTSPNSSDTDADGLFDREEARVYGTDPLNKDTDGDSFTDGAEVQAGYNPKGSGKLYDFN